MKGLVHIYTGNGKGKTTAAVGLAVRAVGNDFKVLFVQFLKGSKTGEMKIFDMFSSNLKFVRSNDIKGFIWNMNEEEKADLKKMVSAAFNYVKEELLKPDWDMVVLDEILGVISNNLIDLNELCDIIKNKNESTELVLTGRNAPMELIELSHYVSEINPVKHPMETGIKARKGIEF